MVYTMARGEKTFYACTICSILFDQHYKIMTKDRIKNELSVEDANSVVLLLSAATKVSEKEIILDEGAGEENETEEE